MQKNSVIFLKNVEVSKDDVYNWVILLSNIFDESTKYNFYIWKFIHCHKKTVRLTSRRWKLLQFQPATHEGDC